MTTPHEDRPDGRNRRTQDARLDRSLGRNPRRPDLPTQQAPRGSHATVNCDRGSENSHAELRQPRTFDRIGQASCSAASEARSSSPARNASSI
jgi:hypothetical protein